MADTSQTTLTLNVVLPIIAAAIGAAGAVGGQIVSSVVAGRRDKRRFNWEREQAQKQEERLSAERFLEHKRLTFAEFIQLARKASMTLTMVELAVKHRGIEAASARLSELEDASGRLAILVAEFELLEPLVHEAAQKVAGHINIWHIEVVDLEGEPMTPDERPKDYRTANRLINDCIIEMRRSLGVRQS